MLIAVFNPEQKEWLERAILHANRDFDQFGIAFDPIDNSIKWKVGTGPWSPPVTTKEM